MNYVVYFFASFTLVLFFVIFRTSVTKMEQEVAALNEQKRKDIKEKLVSTAFEYLVENGLENSSIRDLCKAIGISTGSMYYWFDGKGNSFYDFSLIPGRNTSETMQERVSD